MDKPVVIVLVGPTAVGKTETALTLAQELNCEIISADSMQVYRGMNIGTAKASQTEQQLVKHHLLDIVNPDQRFTVAEWVRLAEKAIAEITSRNRLPLITGGTGLYVNALIDGFLFLTGAQMNCLEESCIDKQELNQKTAPSASVC